jgi:hypothetical protein
MTSVKKLSSTVCSSSRSLGDELALRKQELMAEVDAEQAA